MIENDSQIGNYIKEWEGSSDIYDNEDTRMLALSTDFFGFWTMESLENSISDSVTLLTF